MSDLKIGCLIMAAGNAERFGENKLAAKFGGKSLIEHALDAVPVGVFSCVCVVTQYPQIEAMAKMRGFSVLYNEHPDWGISHTIFLGTTAMRECDGILYLVSDQPLLQSESVARIVERWKQSPEKIVGAAHGGTRGNPNLFPKRFFDELLQLKEDHGGNTVIRRHEEDFVPIEVGKNELTDCDTPKALSDLQSP